MAWVLFYGWIDPSFDHDKFIVFFDGSLQMELSICGVGVVLWLDRSNMYKIWMCCVSSSNTKSKLLYLWIILYFSKHLQLDGIQIYGDAKVIIDWASNVCNINILHLSAWMKLTLAC